MSVIASKMKYETIKICVDDCKEGISGWIYNGHARKRLRFSGTDDLVRRIYRIISGVHYERPDDAWFTKENGFEDFDSAITLPWSSKYLFTRRGKIGSIILRFSMNQNLWNGTIMIIDSGKTEYSRKFDSKELLSEELERLSSAMMIDDERVRARVLSRLMIE